MKKAVILLAFLFAAIMPASAETIKVEALSDFTTENPPETLTVKAVTDLNLDDELLILEGNILKGDIVDVSSPKRLKRDATFSFILTEYTDNYGIVHKVERIDNKIVKGKFTTRFDYKGVAKSAALSVGNHFVKGLSMGYAAVEGAVKNEEGSRLKSGAVSLYESTPLSYVEKGQDIVIDKNQVFILNFKLKNKDDDENDENDEALPVEENTYKGSEKILSMAEEQETNENTTGDNDNLQEQAPSQIEEVPDVPSNTTEEQSKVTEDSGNVEYEEHDGFHLRRRTKKYPPEMENQPVPDTAEPMSVPDPVNNQPLAPLDLPETY